MPGLFKGQSRHEDVRKDGSGIHLKALYLFNGRARFKIIEDVKAGLMHDGSMYGMMRMSKYGIKADYVELEKIFSVPVATWMRKNVLNVYFDHLPFFFKLFKYDIVFSSTAFGSQLLRTLVPKKRPLWVMQGVSISGFLKRSDGLRQRVFKWMVGRAGGIVAFDHYEVGILKSIYPRLVDRIIMIHYPVDTDFFKPSGLQESNQILTVGVDPGRDYETFLRACSGFGNLRVIVATHPARLKNFQPLPKNVHVEKYGIRDLIHEYDKAKVFVLPLDTSSGLNNAMGCSTVVEAMSMGKAIVATRTPTMESFITDGVNGLLVEMGDSDGMAKAIQRLLNDDSLRFRLGQEARRFVVENCDTEIFVKHLASFFKHITRQEFS